ncbi:MAG: hypothetical protein ACOYU7_00240 [Bacillota bacterium]
MSKEVGCTARTIFPMKRESPTLNVRLPDEIDLPVGGDAVAGSNRRSGSGKQQDNPRFQGSPP